MKRILFLMLSVVMTMQASSVTLNPTEKKKSKSSQRAKAGDHNPDPERIGRELGLNDEQMATFATIYAEYREAMQDDKPAEDSSLEGSMEDALQIVARITGGLDREIRIANLRKDYVSKFLQVLTPQQLDRLYMMERSGGAEHGRQRELQGKRGGRPDIGGPQDGLGGPGMGRPGGFGGGFGPM